MKNSLKKFWNDEAGFVVTVEMILVATILVIGLVAGLTMLRDTVLAELSDTAQAFGRMDQSYNYSGVAYGATATSAGFSYTDAPDGSDATAATVATATGVVVADTGAAANAFVNEGS